MRRDLAQHARGLGLKLQHIPANHGIEEPIECHLGGIAFEERHVIQREIPGACCRRSDRFARPVDADDLAAGSYDLPRAERDVAASAADIEDAHTG